MNILVITIKFYLLGLLSIIGFMAGLFIFGIFVWPIIRNRF